jgi:DNA-binding MarR family transcriptional regulator
VAEPRLARRTVDPFTVRELAAWRGFLRAHARLFVEVGEQLEKLHGISMDGYAVLVTLDEAGGERVSMNALPLEVSSSTGVFGRLVESLERQGLITSENSGSRTSGLRLSLTAAGRERLDAARITHRAHVRMSFLACVTPDEQDVLGRVWQRILAN